MIKVLLLSIIFVFSSSVFANGPIAAVTIKGLTIHDFGNEVFINLNSPVTNAEGCQRSDVLVILKTHPLFKEMYAAVLATYQANGKIAGWVNGCNQTAGAPILTRLDLVR